MSPDSVPPPSRRGRRILPPAMPRALALALVVTVTLTLVIRVGGTPGPAPGSPPRQEVLTLLDAVAVVPARADVPGYERDCTGDAACVFGPAWSDSTTAPGSGNGCSTRHDILSRDLRGARHDPSDPCRVTGGTLVDPYSGRVVDTHTTGIGDVHVDHVYPLAAAWDMGAWSWTAERRAAFANDTVHNLLAVLGPVNTDKGDATPAGWLPPDPARHCFYAARYLTAAVVYGLPVSEADRDALAGAASRCP